MGIFLGLYLEPISFQLEVWPEPRPGDSDEFVIPAEKPCQAPSRKPSLLSMLILTPAICSYLATAFYTACMSRRRDTKTVISLVYVDTVAKRRVLLRADFPSYS